jgi:hypothetical protein
MNQVTPYAALHPAMSAASPGSYKNIQGALSLLPHLLLPVKIFSLGLCTFMYFQSQKQFSADLQESSITASQHTVTHTMAMT